MHPGESLKVPTGLRADQGLAWLVATRLCVVAFALLATTCGIFLFNESNVDLLKSLFLPIAFFFGVSGVSAIWMRGRSESVYFQAIQFSIDISLITGIIYVTGGPFSPFLFLYLPLVMAASILGSRTAALIVAFICAITYSLLSWLMMSQRIPMLDGSLVSNAPAAGGLLQVIGLASGMVLMAVLTSLLTRLIKASFVLVEQSKRDLSELSQRQREMIDGLPTGVNHYSARRINRDNQSGCKVAITPFKSRGSRQAVYSCSAGSRSIARG